MSPAPSSGRAARHRSALAAVLLALLGVLVAACGIPEDSAPRDLPPEEGSATEALPATPEAGTGARVFFLTPESATDQDQLQPASRDVAPTPTAALQALLAGLNAEEQARRWRTAIPSGTTLLSTVQRPDGTLDVDVSNQFFQATGDFQVRAVAQLVFTAAAIDGVQRVRILVDGQPQEWPRGDGVLQSEPLTPYAYPDLDPTSQPEYPPPQPASPQPSPTAPATTVSPVPSTPVAPAPTTTMP